MLRSFRKIQFIYIFIDLAIVFSAFCLSYVFKYNTLTKLSINPNFQNFREYTFVFILWFIFILIFFRRSDLYSTNRGLSIPKEISRVIINSVYASILIGAVIFFAQYKFFSRQIFLVNFACLCLFLSAWRTIKRIALRKRIEKGFYNINVLIVGAGRVGKSVLDEIMQNPWLGFKVIGFLDDKIKEAQDGKPVLGKLEGFNVVAKKYFIDEVIITIPSERLVVSELIREAKGMSLGVNIVPEHFDEPLPALNINYLGIIPLISYKEKIHHPAEFALKRFMDFIFSLIALIILSPLFAVIAILIKLDSKGPVFYIQKRVGSKGKIFDFYKFRSMVDDADKLKAKLLDKNEVSDGIIFKIKNDPRATGIGRVLRRNSLDELPQLINVFKGEMSLVGPRPPTPDEVEKYHHNYMQRLSIKPGITGMSQVRGRSELTFRRWVKWDIWYVNNWSFGLDLKILFWTIPAVLQKKGAY